MERGLDTSLVVSFRTSYRLWVTRDRNKILWRFVTTENFALSDSGALHVEVKELAENRGKQYIFHFQEDKPDQTANSYSIVSQLPLHENSSFYCVTEISNTANQPTV